MGRRRTLINDFGANWTTGRVSVKKRKKKKWPTNMIVIRIIIIRFYRFCVTKFNHEYSYNSNSRTRIIVSYHFVYCFPAFLLFHPLFLLFSHQFLFFYIFSQIFSLFSYFFFFRRVSSVMFSDSLQTRWQIKKV